MSPTSILHWFRRRYWTCRLKRAICKHDMAGVKRALAHGAPLDGWRGKGPHLRVSFQCPGLRMRPQGALNMAYHWSCPPQMFQVLLEAGADVDEFNFDLGDMQTRATRLDKLGIFGRYRGWVREHGPNVEALCQAAQQAQALALATLQPGGAGRVQRL